MDDSTTSFSPLPRSSLGGSFRSTGLGGSGGGRSGGSRPSVGGLLQDEDMSLALAGADDYDDDEADVDPFQRAPGLAAVRAPFGGRSAAAGAGGDGDEDDTVRLAGAGGADAGRSKAAATAEFFYGGSMASTSAAGRASAASGAAATTPASASAPTAAASGYAPPTPSAQNPTAGASRTTSSANGALDGTAGDEDDWTDSSLEAQGFPPEVLARIRSLRDERDGLRTMNTILEDVHGALKTTEGKMEASPAPEDMETLPREISS